MFWKRIFLNRMLEYQVKFCHHSGLRLWRTRMLFSTKPKGHKSNVHISWMYRYRFYDLKVHFWWPNKRLKCNISSWHTLYAFWSRKLTQLTNMSHRQTCHTGTLDSNFFHISKSYSKFGLPYKYGSRAVMGVKW